MMNSKNGNHHSYSDILKASSIIGGSNVVNYLISMVKIKVVAMLLGPSGVGLISLYNSATGLIGTLSGLGINTSGVREVADACSKGDSGQIARTIKTLQRASLFTGVLGWIITTLFAYPLSVWVFGSERHAKEIVILGVTLTFGAISGGQKAIVQGTRRIGDLARLNVLVAITSAVIGVSMYAWLRNNGIIPVLIVTALINLGFTWWFIQRIKIVQIDQPWAETFVNSKQLVQLGLAFMYGGLLSSIVGLVLRALIIRNIGLDSNGIYQAAWGISGMFANFILVALGTDFYPRLTAVAQDDQKVNILVNEQIEIGILLALPGIVGTLIFAPWLMQFFYSSKFVQGAAVLPWFLIGVFFQVFTFPIGTIMRAKGSVRWIYIGQTESNFFHLILCIMLVPIYGIKGAGAAFAIHTVIHGFVVVVIAKHISKLILQKKIITLFLITLMFIANGILLNFISNKVYLLILGSALWICSLIFSLRMMIVRLDKKHKIVKFCRKFHLLSFFLGAECKKKDIYE